MLTRLGAFLPGAELVATPRFVTAPAGALLDNELIIFLELFWGVTAIVNLWPTNHLYNEHLAFGPFCFPLVPRYH